MTIQKYLKFVSFKIKKKKKKKEILHGPSFKFSTKVPSHTKVSKELDHDVLFIRCPLFFFLPFHYRSFLTLSSYREHLPAHQPFNYDNPQTSVLRESAFSAIKRTSCSNAKQLTQIDVDSVFSRRRKSSSKWDCTSNEKTFAFFERLLSPFSFDRRYRKQFWKNRFAKSACPINSN